MKYIKKNVRGYNTRRTIALKTCEECSMDMEVLASEVKRGAGKFCSRNCYYVNLKKTRPRDQDSWAWKGDSVGKEALHNWVQRKLGKPNKCEHCLSTTKKQYDWANISQNYKRDVSDWIRLCRSCHAKYDYPTRSKKWAMAVIAKGWDITKIKI